MRRASILDPENSNAALAYIPRDSWIHACAAMTDEKAPACVANQGIYPATPYSPLPTPWAASLPVCQMVLSPAGLRLRGLSPMSG